MGLSAGIVRAEEMPDLSMNGQSSISITMRDKNTDEAIPGGMLELIQIASVAVDNGFVFVPTGQFAAEDFTFDFSEKADLSDPALAASINTYVENHSASVTQRTQKPIGTEGAGTGKAVFEGLDLGVYLIREIETLKGFTLTGEVIKVKLDGYYVIPDKPRQLVNYTTIQTGVHLAVTGLMCTGIALMAVIGTIGLVRKRRQRRSGTSGTNVG